MPNQPTSAHTLSEWLPKTPPTPRTTDEIVEKILSTYDTITVVGASANTAKAANEVPAHMKHLGWRIIPVNPHRRRDRR